MSSFSSWIDKLRRSGGSSATISAALLEDAVYLAFDDTIQKVEIDASGWLQALTKALSEGKYHGCELVLTLSASHYQTYQIEKPELPKEEWSVGLPFLLKDLVTERVTEIVADAVELPGGNRVQTYVLSKRVLAPILALCEKHDIALRSIHPEDEVWGQSLADTSNFVLLHQSKGGSFKISAFVEHKVCFNRTIRGVMAPLTGEMGSSLQIDGLALELQRSIDYLSSQVKQAQFHKLHLSCDDENDAELVQALEERLSVKVSPLQENEIHSGELLSSRALQLPSEAINLYPAHLKPKKELFTLNAVLAAWVITAVIVGGFYGYVEYENGVKQQQVSRLTQQSNQVKQQLSEMQSLEQQHKPSPAKLAAAERLENDIRAKRTSLQAVGQFEQKQQLGFSGVMNALAVLGRNDISLSTISVSPDTLNVKGLAREPSSVPNWIKQFKNELDLVGRNFETLKIGRNEDDIVTFELMTKRQGAQ
ncbi:MSHA biogenesis protein MshI [Vibrio sp. SCSIO 43136]|uniref:MSHA biogenesis protein MshI n=1 Tax=Vibrio sp. SCSIO 43136 TaxID=2819101 RepID=UPI002074CD16|nr:MSHA biogenesis protein MshI [Vibrio sp. SCSIO 43136]USD65026.1 MSHA biogenesis protein MshI [Vibrio sp. SCSIO 43136]